jgi:hypothetical protein
MNARTGGMGSRHVPLIQSTRIDRNITNGNKKIFNIKYSSNTTSRFEFKHIGFGAELK